MNEMVTAIKRLKDGKSPDGDGIPADVLKYGGAKYYGSSKSEKKTMYHKPGGLPT